MVNELEIKSMKVDWKKIIDMTLKRKDWGKTYTLYTYGRTTITCVLKELNFEDHTAWFRIKVEYTEKDNYKRNETKLVRYVLNHFSLEDFKMHINKSIESLIEETKYYVLSREAREKFEHMEIDVYDIGEDEIGEEGYQEEYDAIESIPDGDIQSEAMYLLRDRVCDKLNEPYESAKNEYIETHKVIIEGFEQIKEELSKEDKKNE